MESDRFQLLSNLFERAIALPPDQRPAFLDQHCPSDPTFRSELEALLGQTEKPDSPVVTAAGLDALFEEAGIKPRSGESGGLDGKIPDVIGGNSHRTPSPMSSVAQPSDGGGAGHTRPSASPSMPLLTGQYRILRVVGEGGMGIVYEAEQAFPKRRVALKSIRPGLFSRRMLRRFQNEAHILGRLQHPGIAQIYEAGASDPQSPDDAFFVMEFVDGPPLNTFADTRSPPLRTVDKLGLMIKVCDAVHHAHQRGVIHRDLKPGNILVSEAEGKGADAQPKILDFGVARVTDDQTLGGVGGVGGRAETMQTHAGQLIGTLAYMSPEQISVGPRDASGNVPDVDVRTDVYALGVVLYQLLTGKLPLDLSEKSIPDAAQMVRESEPSRLGTIDRSYRGDLETIVAKALEKDRARRYQSAAALGEDIHRYLNGEAIAAKRDSAAYVLRKFIKRHKGAVAAASLIFIGLVAFAIVASFQAQRNRVLAERLADQLVIANADRGRLESLSGTPSLGERTLWTERLQRPDLPETYWALWEFYSRQPILASTGGAGLAPPSRLLLTPDASTLIRTGKEGEIQGWSPDLAKCLWRIEPDGRSFNAAAISPDGAVAVFVGSNGKIVLLDPVAGAVTLRPDGAGSNFLCVAFTPNGQSFITGEFDGRLTEWSADTGKRLRRIHAHKEPVISLAVRPDGEVLVTSVRGGVCTVIALADGKVLGLLPLKGATSTRFQFSHDGSHFYALDNGGILHDFDEHFSEVGTLNSGDARANNMFVLDSGNVLVTGPGGQRIWNMESRSLWSEMPGEEGGTTAIAQGPRPGTFYTSGAFTCTRLWEDSTLRCSTRLLGGTTAWMLGGAPSPDAKVVASVDGNGVVRAWNTESGTLISVCDGPPPRTERDRRGGRALTWRPGTRRFIAGFYSGMLAEFECTNTELKMIASWPAYEGSVVDSEIFCTAFSRDGSVLASGAQRGDILLWNGTTHERIGAIATTQTGIRGLSLSPDGKRLVAAGIGPGIALYDVQSGAMLRNIPDTFINYRVCYSPDGSVIAAARSRPEIQLLDPQTLEVRRTLLAHGKVVIDVQFDESGRKLASGSADGTLRLWDTNTGRALVSLDVGAEVSVVGFIPGTGGKRLMSAGMLGSVRMWDLGYYDRHISANASFFMSRLAPGLGASVREKDLLAWARAAAGDPLWSFNDPAESVPLRPNTPAKVGQ